MNSIWSVPSKFSVPPIAWLEKLFTVTYLGLGLANFDRAVCTGSDCAERRHDAEARICTSEGFAK